MKKLPAIFLLLFLISPTLASAKVNVEISGNGPGSKSSVNVESRINSSTTTKSTLNNQTDIRIETNGEVKEYHGSDESVYLESGNGNSSVSVKTDNNIDTDEENSSSSASVSAQPDKLDKPEKKNLSFNLLEIIKRELESILDFFRG